MLRERLMYNGQKIVVVMPAYNAARTLRQTYEEVMAQARGSTAATAEIKRPVIASRALRGGMPLWKYLANRFLTLFENLFMGAKLSEYHTGYRAFAPDPARASAPREKLRALPLPA